MQRAARVAGVVQRNCTAAALIADAVIAKPASRGRLGLGVTSAAANAPLGAMAIATAPSTPVSARCSYASRNCGRAAISRRFSKPQRHRQRRTRALMAAAAAALDRQDAARYAAARHPLGSPLVLGRVDWVWTGLAARRGTDGLHGSPLEGNCVDALRGSRAFLAWDCHAGCRFVSGLFARECRWP